MSRDLIAQESLDSTLDGIVAHALDRVCGCEAASIMVLNRDRHLNTLAATSEVGPESNRIQNELGEGPCFDVVNQEQEVLRVPDMAGSAQRWPHYVPQARALGIGSMMGFLLRTTRETLGLLNLYSSKSEAFTPRAEEVGWLFASHAAVAFASARKDAQLHEAIATRQGIGEAMGVLMHRYKVPRSQTFEMLKKVSQGRNVKLRDIARQVVETGELPGNEHR